MNNNSLSVEFGLNDGEVYIIGREGEIALDSPTVSKCHVEMKIKNGRIYLRDLNSTNGTYLVIGDKLVNFYDGYVTPHQAIVMGDVRCTVRGLLEDWILDELRS